MAWVIRGEREGGLTEVEQRQFDHWVATSTRQLGAYARAQAANAHLARSQALGGDYVPADTPALPHRRSILYGAATAIAASIAGIVGYDRLTRGQTLTTDKGDVRRVALADGSSVTLNTKSRVRVDLDTDRRSLRLDDGEALFDVAHDAHRPFVVTAGAVSVTAVGTSFIVYRLGDDVVRVTVREGVVDVRDGSGRSRRVHAPALAVVDERRFRSIALTPAALDEADAWQQGRIALTDVPLGVAAAEFSRYSDYIIIIDDPAVAQMRISGVFASNDPRGFAQAAALSLGIVATADAVAVRLKPRRINSSSNWRKPLPPGI